MLVLQLLALFGEDLKGVVLLEDMCLLGQAVRFQKCAVSGYSSLFLFVV